MRAKQPGRPWEIRGEGTVCTRRGESVSGCRQCAFARFGLDCGAILPRRVAQGGVFFFFFYRGGRIRWLAFLGARKKIWCHFNRIWGKPIGSYTPLHSCWKWSGEGWMPAGLRVPKKQVNAAFFFFLWMYLTCVRDWKKSSAVSPLNVRAVCHRF